MTPARRAALVTGASSGIGHATALALARRGTHVLALARRADALDALVAQAATLPGRVVPMAGDVRDAGALVAAVAHAEATFGVLDVAVANAGVGHRGSLVEADWAELDALLRTNIDGVLHTVRASVPALRRAGGGHVVVVSSVSAGLVMPYAALYAASKTLVSQVAAALAVELAADHIAVSDMWLGRTATGFDAKRMGKGARTAPTRSSSMAAEVVAGALVRQAERTHGGRVVLRAKDRALVWAGALFPGLVARLAARQYR